MSGAFIVSVHDALWWAVAAICLLLELTPRVRTSAWCIKAGLAGVALAAALNTDADSLAQQFGINIALAGSLLLLAAGAWRQGRDAP